MLVDDLSLFLDVLVANNNLFLELPFSFDFDFDFLKFIFEELLVPEIIK